MGNFRRNDNRERSGGRSRDRDNRGRSGGRGRFNDRSSGRDNRRTQMFEVVCDKCRKNCEVPFKPSGDKPVLCSDCFRKKDSSSGSSRNQPQSGISLEQFNQINKKLDKIIAILDNLEIDLDEDDEESEEDLDDSDDDSDEDLDDDLDEETKDDSDEESEVDMESDEDLDEEEDLDDSDDESSEK